MKKRLLLALVCAVIILAAVPTFAMARSITSPIPNNTKYGVGDVVKFRNYVKPALENPGSREMWYYVDLKTEDGWILQEKVLGDWMETGWNASRTRCNGRFIPDEAGKYRVLAKMYWWNDDGDELVWRSKYNYFTVVDSEYEGARFVSKPHTARAGYVVGDSVKITSYVRPKLSDDYDRVLYYYVDLWDADEGWIFMGRKRATLYNSSEWRSRTLARAWVDFDDTGRYRILAKFRWYDEDGDLHTRKSGYTYIRVRD